jgi:hypothetical protein
VAVINDPNTAGNIAKVGEVATGPGGAADGIHVWQRPLPTSIGHYRTNHRCAIIAAQAAGSRLFTLRNTGTNLVIPTRLVIKWLQTAAHTAAIEDSIDVFKATGFTTTDTTNTVTPTASLRRTSMSALAGVDIRGVTIAGAAAGMTGGTLTLDGTSVGQLPQLMLLAVPTASTLVTMVIDDFDDVNGTHPFVLAQNEGIVISNRVLLGAAAGSSVYIDCSFAVAANY